MVESLHSAVRQSWVSSSNSITSQVPDHGQPSRSMPQFPPPYKNGVVTTVQNSELVKVSEMGHV